MTSNNPKILIIGAGVTGSLCAFGLKNKLPCSHIFLLDKARGAGGRMTTTRNSTGNKVDLGAQYISTSKSFFNQYNTEYQSLLSNLIIQPFNKNIPGMKVFSDDIMHFTAPEGMNQVVKHFINKSGCPVSFNSRVKDIITRNDKFVLKTYEGAEENCDIIISTIPIPQFMAFPISQDISPDIAEKLKSVTYSTRFALIFYYNRTDDFPRLDWETSYLDDDVFRFVSFDNLKRNQDEPPSVIFHTNVRFGEDYKTKDKSDMEDLLVSHAKRLFPDWPKPFQIKCHKWLYSQVVKEYSGQPGCIKVMNNPMMILAGDAFTTSTLNGCISSARAVVEMLSSELINK